MLVIRLTRTGKIHAPHYRIVVQEARSKLTGSYVDLLGHYHPATAGKELVVDAEKAQKWLGNGAQPSKTVTNLFVKLGILDESRKIKHFYTDKVKEVAAEPVAAKEEAPAAEEPAEEVVAETPAEEATEAPAEVETEAPTEEATPAEAEEPATEEKKEEIAE